MTDVVAARAAIRAVVEPLKLKCHGYRVKEQLGRAQGEDWLDDDIVVVTKTTVSAGEGFPIQEYRDNSWTFEGAGRTREGAMKALQEGIEGEVPKWEQLLADDVELTARVGQRVRAVKETTYYLTDIVKRAVDTDGDVGQAMRDSAMKLPAGTELKVVDHEPGKVKLRASWGDEWWVYRWRFYNCLTTNTPGERIPDPHYEFLEAS